MTAKRGIFCTIPQPTRERERQEHESHESSSKLLSLVLLCWGITVIHLKLPYRLLCRGQRIGLIFAAEGRDSDQQLIWDIGRLVRQIEVNRHDATQEHGLMSNVHAEGSPDAGLAGPLARCSCVENSCVENFNSLRKRLSSAAVRSFTFVRNFSNSTCKYLAFRCAAIPDNAMIKLPK